MPDEFDSFEEGTTDGDDARLRRSRGGDRYVPTPEEIEAGAAQAPAGREDSEEASERPSGIFKRFRLRRRGGVGKERKYVQPDDVGAPATKGGGQPPDEPPPDESPPDELPAGAAPDDDDGRPGDAAPGPETAVPDVADASETTPDADDSAGDPRSTPSHEVSTTTTDSRAEDRADPGGERVGGVSIKTPKRRAARKEKATEPWVSLRDRRVAELHRRASDHGHEMSELVRVPGSDNMMADCTDCGRKAELVASREDMETYVRYDVRGPALERMCDG